MLRRSIPLLAALAALLAMTACASEADDSALTGSDSGGSATADGGGDSGDGGENAAAGAGSGELEWSSCGGGSECAELDVPIDSDDPDGDTLTLSIGRVPATGDRIGALFVNPGGPGGTASDFAAQLVFALPEEITERFDIVGVDPRGLGASAIDCGGDMQEL